MTVTRLTEPRVWRATLAAGLLLLVPLAFYRGFAGQFSSTKIFLTEVLVLLGLVVCALGLIWGRLAWPGQFHLLPPLALLSVAVLQSCWNSPVPEFSLIEAEYFLCGPIWLLLLVASGGGEAAARSVAKLAAVAGTVVALITLVQWSGYDPLLIGGYRVPWGTMVSRMRLYSTLGNPNFVAGYLIGTTFLAMASVASTSKPQARAAWYSSVAVMFAAIVGTRSRGAWAGLAAGLILVRLVWRRRVRPAPQVVSGTTAERSQTRSLLTPVVVAVLASNLGWVAESLLTRLEGRVYLWRVCWQMFGEHPLLGSGWGTLQLRFLDLQARFLGTHPDLVRHWTNVHQAHNDALQILLEAGIVGFVAFGWVVWTYAREVWQGLEAGTPSERLWLGASAGGVTAILVDSLFNFQLAVAPTFLLLFTLLAFPRLAKGNQTAGHDPCTLPEVEPAARQRHFAVLRLAASVAVLVVVVALLAQVARRAAAERAYTVGLHLERELHLGQAEHGYRRGLGRNLLNGRLHFGLARVLYLQERSAEALAEVLRAERTYADSRLEVLKGRILEQMGFAQQALGVYRRALALDPTLKFIRADIDRLSRAVRAYAGR